MVPPSRLSIDDGRIDIEDDGGGGKKKDWMKLQISVWPADPVGGLLKNIRISRNREKYVLCVQFSLLLEKTNGPS